MKRYKSSLGTIYNITKQTLSQKGVKNQLLNKNTKITANTRITRNFYY